jgi:hypothetical protein
MYIHSSFLLLRRSCTMPANGPDILNLGCPNLTIFSFGCSSSLAAAPFLHVRIRAESRARHRVHLPVEGDLGSQASDLVAVFGVDICEDRVCALGFVSFLHFLALHVTRHTGGICWGRSTSLLSVISPLSSGHSRSALPIVSQPSASWLIRVIRPYLTCRCILKPFSTLSLKLPVALIVSFWPL